MRHTLVIDIQAPTPRVHRDRCPRITTWAERTGPDPDDHVILDYAPAFGALTRADLTDMLETEGYTGHFGVCACVYTYADHRPATPDPATMHTTQDPVT